MWHLVGLYSSVTKHRKILSASTPLRHAINVVFITTSHFIILFLLLSWPLFYPVHSRENRKLHYTCGPGSSVGIATDYGLDGPGSNPGGDFPPVQTGPGAHPASCKMGTRSYPGVKCGRGVLLTTHPLLVPRSRKSRAVPLSTL